MGLEAECTVRVGRKASTGTAQLEGETLLFRGGDLRLEIPFERMRDVSVDGDALVIAADDETRFELGAQVADRWMRLIKQPKGLFEKLEVGAQSRVAVVDVTDPLFLTALRERTASVAEGRVPEGFAVIFFGAETRDGLRKLAILRARMVDAGTLWIVRPKGSKAITEADVLEAVRDAGLVDTKVVALSRTHTAHKCVIPVELRGQARRRPPILTIPPSAPVLGGAGSGSGSRAKPEKSGLRRSARPPPRKKGTPKAKKR
ncbi:MAG TPA: hypothetical protein VE987_05260 [Polyangiaceae bacterium]|nr:hypothetical protein [Polyangiaceae bacterium]